ncbi:MAG: GRAM domain-containing protein [Nonlabens sp.]|uniref:GRAM domain-containing protein n=1 Tax=Nonlabens sp. TaxID=1888209 RepID=UPI00321B4BAB
MIKMFNKEFWITAMGFGIPMWIIMTLFYGVTDEFSLTALLINFIPFVIIAGPLFATLMILFARYSFKKITITIPENETLIKEFGANLFRGKEGVGGKIALTDKSVLFKSHKINIQTGETVIKIEDIISYEVKNGLFNLLKNDVTLKTTEKDYRFIIQGRDEFITELKKLNMSI